MISKLFDTIGRAFTSIGAVIFVMTMVIASMIFFSHTLFLEVFPESMTLWEKKAATWAMALGWELTVLITTVNARHLSKRLPWLMAIASGVIVLFFIHAFDLSLERLQLAQRWFVGILAATINYIYADLFYSKWKERTDTIERPARLQHAESKVVELQSALDETRAALQQSGATVQQQRADLKELAAFRTKTERELTCPYCKVPQNTYGTLRAHQGHCDKNPKKQKA